jgi:hypothetical protein
MPEMSGSPTALAVPSRGSPVRTCRGALLGGTLVALVVAARSEAGWVGSWRGDADAFRFQPPPVE